MYINRLLKILEEKLEDYPDSKKDFINCILEIDKKPQINNHKHTYAVIESIEEDRFYNPCAVIKIYFKED